MQMFVSSFYTRLKITTWLCLHVDTLFFSMSHLGRRCVTVSTFTGAEWYTEAQLSFLFIYFILFLFKVCHCYRQVESERAKNVHLCHKAPPVMLLTPRVGRMNMDYSALRSAGNLPPARLRGSICAAEELTADSSSSLLLLFYSKCGGLFLFRLFTSYCVWRERKKN